MSLLYAALYVAALGILSHFVGQALPRAHFDPQKFPYRSADWENGGKVYEKLGIKHWKDRLPDMSKIMPDMVKKKNVGGEITGHGRAHCRDLRCRVRALGAHSAVAWDILLLARCVGGRFLARV